MADDGGLLFDDGKDPAALRTIGEVAQAFGIRQHVLRYWEQQFPMLRPLTRSGGRRYYRPADVELVATIDRLVNREGYTLKGARQAIEKGRASPAVRTEPVEGPSSSSAATLHATSGPSTSAGRTGSEIVPELRAIRQRLAAALAA